MASLPDDLGPAAVVGEDVSADFGALQWFELPAESLLRPTVDAP